MNTIGKERIIYVYLIDENYFSLNRLQGNKSNPIKSELQQLEILILRKQISKSI